jgi:hydrogenase expression/formation protein HypC
MTDADRGPACSGPTCITCSDTAVVVTVRRLLADDMAEVDTGVGPPELVSVALVEAEVGDRVLVHAGEAIGKPAPPTGS